MLMSSTATDSRPGYCRQTSRRSTSTGPACCGVTCSGIEAGTSRTSSYRVSVRSAFAALPCRMMTPELSRSSEGMTRATAARKSARLPTASASVPPVTTSTTTSNTAPMTRAISIPNRGIAAIRALSAAALAYSHRCCMKRSRKYSRRPATTVSR